MEFNRREREETAELRNRKQIKGKGIPSFKNKWNPLFGDLKPGT
jgi:hypothetical protein